MATKGGQVPVSIEKRAKGKKVTIISGVQGNASALCSALTRLLGIGGTTHVRSAMCADVEVQGEQVERVTEVLGQLGCVRGLPKARETAAIVVERDCAYDSLLGEEGRRAKPRAQKAAALPPEPPDDAPCRSWHGHWIYCSGNCEKSEFDDIWADSNCNPYARPVSSAVRVAIVDAAALNKALKPLGMTADIGDAVREWINYKAQLAKETERKRSMPVASLCAAAPVQPKGAALVCDVCGAEFALKRTLKLHLQAHKREQANTEQASGEVMWRSATAEHAAAFEAQAEDYDAWADAAWAGQETYGSSGDEEYRPSRAAPSLASWLAPTVRSTKQDHRRYVQRPNPRDQQVPCPICGKSFSVMEMDEHVDVCLAVSAEQSNVAEATVSNRDYDSTADGGDDGVLPLELLHSLLEMDLAESVAECFWQRFEDMTVVRGLPVREAFLEALTITLQEDADVQEVMPHSIPTPGTAANATLHFDDMQADEVDLSESPADGMWQEVPNRSNRWSRKAAGKAAHDAVSQAAGMQKKAYPKSDLKQPMQGQRAKAPKPLAVPVQKGKPSASSVAQPVGRVSRAPADSKQEEPRGNQANPSASCAVHACGGVARAQQSCNATPATRSRQLETAHQSMSSSAVPTPCPSCGLPFLPDILELHVKQCEVRHKGGAPADAKQHAEWLRTALAPLLGPDAAESVAAGVEVVMEHGDEEAAANAVELVSAELPTTGPEAVRADLILAQFSARVFLE